MMMKKLFDLLLSLVTLLAKQLDFVLNPRALRVVPICVRCADMARDSTRISR
jgi:hypothetical protein